MPKKYMFYVQRFEKAIAQNLGQDKADAILEGCESLTAKSPKPERARMMNIAMERLSKACPRETAVAIRESCACKPPAFLAEAKRIKGESATDDEFFRKLSDYGKVGFYFREGGKLYCAYRPSDCVCGMVGARKEKVPFLWCECCKGHAKWILEECLGKKVTMVILETIVSGGRECRFEITSMA